MMATVEIKVTPSAKRRQVGMIFRPMVEMRALQDDADALREASDDRLARLALFVAPAPGRFVPPLAAECH